LLLRFRFCVCAEPVGGGDQLGENTRLVKSVACVRHKMEVSLRPGAMQVPGRPRRRACIVAALDDDAGNVMQLARITYELAFLHESAVEYVMVFYAGKGHRAFVRSARLLVFDAG